MKSSKWSPNRWGAVDEVERTQATTSPTERSRTRSSGTMTSSSGANPADWNTASSPSGEVFRNP